ncbi:uncharacterized protein LOC122672228 [Telopea speciosissima]|uniref:uncharacterized protein LOC122672228 n=1 Tax=Telopea speciosissima TaxID=54955 RepID=UPI001CC752C6|nr:uncharacterized protein LOC122672228 [Telopea speciosissima]
MVKQRDQLWKYVEDLKGCFKCKFCNKEYAGGILRVKYHLACLKGNDVGICSNVPDDVPAEALCALSKENKKAKTGESSTACNTKRSTCCYGPSYAIPSYSTLRTKLVQRARKDIERYVALVKESWSTTGCTIISNIWTGMKERSFINVIAYSPKRAIFLNYFECFDSSKTGLFLRDILEPIIEEIGLEKVVRFILDNASNYGVAISLIMEKYPHIHRIRCAAHGVQLLLKDIDAQISWVKEVFDKAKLVVGFMYKHGTILALMRECTGGKELKKPCKTRFASNLFMLKSILDVEDVLRVMVASAEWRINRHCRSDLGAMVTQIIQSTEFWLNGKDVLSILEPLIIVLCLVDGDGATSPFLYEAMERVRNTIIDRCNRDSSKYKRFMVDYAWKLCSLASKDSYSHFESTLMNNLMKLKSKEIDQFCKDSIVLDKLLEIPINEDDDRVGFKDEGDTMVEDD